MWRDTPKEDVMMDDDEDLKKLNKRNNLTMDRMAVQFGQQDRKRAENVDQYMQGVEPTANE